MKKGSFRNAFEYLSIFFIIVSAIFLLEYFRDSTVRLIIITSLTSFYVVVGILYHFEKKNLKFSQILEYLAIGIITFIILSAVYH